MIQILALLFILFANPAAAQNTTCANKPASDNSNACANTRYVTSAITAAYPNTWLKSVAGTSVNATASGFTAANQALFLSGTLTGTGEGPHAFFSATDTANNSTVGQAISAVRMQHAISTGAGAGNRITLYPILIKSVAAPGTTKALKGYLPFFAKSFFSAGDGGGSGTEMGNAYGGAFQVNLTSGATYYETVQGIEVDVSMQTGSSAKYKNGLLIAGVNSDAVKGSTWEAMLSFTKEGSSTATWDRGIDFTYPPGSWPFHSGTTLIGSSGAGSIGYGVDLSSLTISTSAFKSPGFNVNGSGGTNVATLASAGPLSATTGSFSGTLGASTIFSTGAASGFVMGPRGGSGNSYQWYNPSGTGIKLTDSSSDIVTIDSAGAISTASNVTNLHNYSTVSVPTTSTCGTSPSVDAGSSNHAGKVTFGSATTACTLTFASAYATNAFCTITPAAQPAAVANIPYISAQSKTAFTISGGTASASYYYTCGGN